MMQISVSLLKVEALRIAFCHAAMLRTTATGRWNVTKCRAVLQRNLVQLANPFRVRMPTMHSSAS